jgi:beta-lactam-binding protein with PASTA domain
VGTNIDQAQRNIAVAHLNAQIQEVDSAVQRGQVLKQNPPGGTTVKAGSTVTLTVSRGNQLQMPNLDGLTPNQALAALQKMGWNGTLHQVFTQVNDPNRAGLIVAQDVPPGTGFTRDQTLTVTVGRDNTATSTTTTTSGSFFETPFPGDR